MFYFREYARQISLQKLIFVYFGAFQELKGEVPGFKLPLCTKACH